MKPENVDACTYSAFYRQLRSSVDVPFKRKVPTRLKSFSSVLGRARKEEEGRGHAAA